MPQVIDRFVSINPDMLLIRDGKLLQNSEKRMVQMSSVSQINGLSDLAQTYKLILCDVWGVIHNGVSAFPASSDALKTFRENGHGKVILLTNAPRPDWWVKNQLDDLGVPDTAYDAIVTSGDVTRHDILTRGARKVFALGPEKDRNFYDGLPIELVHRDDAELVTVTGLIDDEAEVPDDYHSMLEGFLQRGLTIICANPDIVVERGDRLVYCGGAVAEKYREMGGQSLYFGKPHAPIYDRALETGRGLIGRDIDKHQVLAIGDGIATDVKGANDADIDCLFVTGGIHSAESGPLVDATCDKVAEFLSLNKLSAEAFLPQLCW